MEVLARGQITISMVADGTDAVIYSLHPSVNVIKRNVLGILSPSGITCEATKTTGNSEPVPATDVTITYKTSESEQEIMYGKTIPVSAGWSWIEFYLYLASGALLDKERIPVVSDVQLEDLESSIDVAIGSLNTGSNNLLRNSGFTGDYLSRPLSSTTELTSTSEMYSPSLLHWDVANVTARDSSISQSGKEAVLSGGSMIQTLHYKMMAGESYIFSFKGKGTVLTFACGGYSETVTLTSDYQRYIKKFNSTSAGTTFSITAATGTVCELQLERGNIVSSWGPSMMDNSSELAYYQSLRYIAGAIKDGSVDMIGGLILASMLQLGNYKDGAMQRVTAGMSGTYNNDDDVAFWGGGTFEQAVKAVMMYKDNPEYQPAEEELAQMANAVITHGGRSILNDVVLRGYVYALGGVFKGKVTQGNGRNVMNEDGSVSFCGGKIRWGADGQPIIEGKLTTALNGTRIEIDPEDNSIKMYNQNNSEVGKINFITEEWNGITNYYPKLTLTKYSDEKVMVRIDITATSMNGMSNQNNNICTFTLGPIGLVYTINGKITKTYPNQ